MRLHDILANALLTVAVLADDRFPRSVTVGGVGIANGLPGEPLIAAAGRQPNATSNVTWAAKFGNNPTVQLTWRVNLTNVPVPNRVRDLGTPQANFSEGLRSANTQYELIWPSNSTLGGNQSLNEYLRATGTNLTINAQQIVLSGSTPFTRDGNNGSCQSVLSDECISDIGQAAQLPFGQAPSWSSIPACKGFFTGLDIVGSGFAINHANETNSTAVRDTYFYPGDTFLAISGDPKPATNLTLYDLELHSLNIITVAYTTPIGGGSLTGSDVLCQMLPSQKSAGSSIGIRDSPAMMALWVALGTSMLAAAYL